MYTCRAQTKRGRTKRNGGRGKREILASPTGENRKECCAGGSGFCKKKMGLIIK